MLIQKFIGGLKLRLLVFIVLVFSISLFAIPRPVYAASKTLEPTRDTYVDSSLATSSYGNLGLGVVKHQPSDSSSSLLLLHFDLTSIPAGSTITSANLKMRLGGCINNAVGSGHIALAAYLTNGSPAWTESSTYAQLSTSGSSIDGFSSQYITCSPGAYYDMDLMPIIPYWVDGLLPNDGLVVSIINGGDYWTRVFYMSEATESSRPKLTINYEVPHEVVPTPDGPTSDEDSPATEDAKKKSESNTVVAESTPESIAPDTTIEPATKLTAKQVKGKSDVELSWLASKTKDVSKYRIYRKVAGGKTYKAIADVDKSKLTFTDTKTKVGVQHSYFIRVVRGDRESLNSPVASIVIQSNESIKTMTGENENSNKSLWMLIYILFMLLVTSLLAYKLLHKKHKELHAKHKKVVAKNKSK